VRSKGGVIIWHVKVVLKKEKAEKVKEVNNMKVIFNSIIPFPGFKAINLFGVLFARKGSKIDDKTINHESIHTA
jgi:hypothetical protein